MSGFDNTYYTNHLNSLYTDSNIYNVDSFLFNLRIEDNNNVIINPAFKTIQNLSYRSDNVDEVNIRAEYISNSNSDIEYTNVVNETASNKFSGVASKEYVSVIITKDSSDIPQNIVIDQINSINNRSTSTSAGYINDNDTDAVTKDHKRMNTYMENVLIGSLISNFKTSFDLIRGDANIINPSTNDDNYKQAKYALRTIANSKLNTLIENMIDLGNSTLCDIVTAKVTTNLKFNSNSSNTTNKRYLNDKFLSNLYNFKGPLYYKLRSEMTKRLNVKSIVNIENNDAQSYFKMIIIDMYIKIFYPLLVYNYISCMMKLYIQNGDFVNSRIALLAKIMYTYYFILKLANIYSRGTSNANQTAILNSVINKLKKYLENVNKIDLQGGSDVMSSIVRDLHSKSNDVVEKSATIQTVSEQIKANQLAMRNVIYNITELRKQYNDKRASLVVLVCILIILLSVCSLLLFIATPENNYNMYTIYIVGIMGLIFITLALGKLISGIVNSK
jgi:hypothetical protein